MSNKNVPVTTSTTSLTVKGEELHIFPPRDAEEAKTRGVFVSPGNNVTYLHLNGNLSSGVLGTPGTTGLVVAYGELADKLGELLLTQVKSAKTPKQKKLTITADANVEIIPMADGDGKIMGNNIEIKVYGFLVDDMYYTTKGGQLVVSQRVQYRNSEKETKVSFF